NPLALLDQGGVQSAAPTQSGVPAQVDPQQKAFVSAILHSTEVTWGEIFQAKGLTYVDPKLHLFSGGVSTGCGGATTAVGPFYCPTDQKVYLDVAFFKQLQRQGQPMDGADGLSVRQELQADCYAGVWANHSQQELNWLQPGDIESALNAASHIGDDTLQQQAQGRVRPDTFTHGTSAQRVKWFKTGFG